MPYRESTEDPRIDVVRRAHTVAEREQVGEVVKRFDEEREHAIDAVAGATSRLYRAQQGTRVWIFRAPPDPEEIERELRELAACKERRVVSEVAFQLAGKRSSLLDELLEQSPRETPSTDTEIVNAALAASMRAAAAHARDVRKVMRETADLVTQAHREEMMMALTGEAPRVHALPMAERAVTLARCRIDLLRANLLALGATTETYCGALGDVLAMLVDAGTGPGQAWKDKVLAAYAALDASVMKLERI